MNKRTSVINCCGDKLVAINICPHQRCFDLENLLVIFFRRVVLMPVESRLVAKWEPVAVFGDENGMLEHFAKH